MIIFHFKSNPKRQIISLWPKRQIIIILIMIDNIIIIKETNNQIIKLSLWPKRQIIIITFHSKQNPAKMYNEIAQTIKKH